MLFVILWCILFIIIFTIRTPAHVNDFKEKYKKLRQVLPDKYASLREPVPLNIFSSKRGQVGYNVNKGETIGLCMYRNGKFMDINTIMFVLLHELAHSMTVAYSHDKEFWDNFSFLLNEAMKIGIYTYEDFKAEPKTHCNMKIGHTPV